MATVKDIDERLEKEESSPLSAEEQTFADAAEAALTPEQKAKMHQLDVICVVRGYQTYTPRLEETNKALKMIADWRDSVGYYDFFKARLEGDDHFHQLWPERIYGDDKYGHLIVGMRLEDIHTDKLMDLEEPKMFKLQGQKLAAVTRFKELHAQSKGVQRYKHILIADVKGSLMGLTTSSQRRKILKELMDIGGNYYPESVWKIFVVNAPMLFSGVWSIVKHWIHPITAAKVNVCSSQKDALKKMAECGIPLESIPEWCGGSHKGVSVEEVLKQYITEQAPVGAGPLVGAAAAAAPAAAAGAAGAAPAAAPAPAADAAVEGARTSFEATL